MYKFLLLIFLSLGIHSYFVPLKITTSHSQNDIIDTLVDEMIFSLNETNEDFKENFTTPLNVMHENCSYEYTKIFIQELCKIHLKTVRCNMEKLRKCCPFLNKSPGNHSSCKLRTETFTEFKNKLKDFLCWLKTHKNICNKTQETGQRNCDALNNH